MQTLLWPQAHEGGDTQALAAEMGMWPQAGAGRVTQPEGTGNSYKEEAAFGRCLEEQRGVSQMKGLVPTPLPRVGLLLSS